MKLAKLSLLFSAISLIASNVAAQSDYSKHQCYTDEYQEELIKKDPSLIQKQQELEDYISNFKKNYNPSDKKAGTIIIPVVIHAITHDGGVGYVSKATIDAQMKTLNDDFQRLNADTSSTRPLFLPYAATHDVEFRLAHLDPSGNCTQGIIRKESQYSYNTSSSQADNIKNASPAWDPKRYFNIWLIDQIKVNDDGSFVAGYARFPGNGINNGYGIVIVDQSFGGGKRTLTHEFGHCFNLLHTFQSGCFGGDGCSDTPPVAAQSFNCSSTRNSCSNDGSFYGGDVVDQYENYMSYANCQNMFTLQQKTRMMAILNSTSTSTGLAQLSTPANLTSTGTADPYTDPICKPIADFSYNKQYICEGRSVTFADESYDATPTGWNWTFTGGTPNTSSVDKPTITYNTPGVYSVTHEPSTLAGSATPVTKTDIITVNSLTADYAGPIIDGFENDTQFDNDWIVENVSGGQTFENNNAAAATDSRSVRLRNFFTSSEGEVDELISPSYDISSAPSKTMKFKIAFAKKASSNSDKLFVYWSTTCGETWSLKLPLTGNALATAAEQTSIYTPGANDWVEKSIDLSSIGNSTNVMFKFTFTSGGGNDLYIDDINIGGSSVGIDEFTNIGNFNVYPNPTSANAKLSFNLIKNVDNLNVVLKNAIGQEVSNIINGQSFNTGEYTLNIDEQRKLPTGIYFIEFNADNVIKIQKLIIQ